MTSTPAATAPPGAQTPGLDAAALTAWWRTHLAEDPRAALDGGRDLTAELIAGGRSNLTYRVGDGHRTWVVRRPPLGHVLDTAHDMHREHQVLTALLPTPVPVPRALALCLDPTVLGAPFSMLSDVPGTAYRTVTELSALGPERTRRVSERMVDTLADVHSVDPDVVGLSGFGRPEGFLARQVRRWGAQMSRSLTTLRPIGDALYRRLEAGAAQADRAAAPGLVHGDYRLDNLLVDDDDRVAAVVDWEMATLGDTLTDLGLLVVYLRLADIAPGTVADACRAPGFLSEDDLLERYSRHRGAEPAELGFHVGLAAYKLAAVLEGINHRHLAGQTVGAGFDGIGEVVDPLLRFGLLATTGRR